MFTPGIFGRPFDFLISSTSLSVLLGAFAFGKFHVANPTTSLPLTALNVNRVSLWTGEKSPFKDTFACTSSPTLPQIKGYAASETENAEVMIDARVGASSSVARLMVMFGAGILLFWKYREFNNLASV